VNPLEQLGNQIEEDYRQF